jgi:hypothetical protein
VADRGEDGDVEVAVAVGEIITAHSMLVLGMAYDRLDCGAAFIDFEFVVGRRIVAAVSGVGAEPLDGIADELLDRRDHLSQSVPVIGIARQRLHVGDELAALPCLRVVATLTLTPAPNSVEAIMADTAYDAYHLRQAIAATGRWPSSETTPARARQASPRPAPSRRVLLLKTQAIPLRPLRKDRPSAVVTLAAIILWMR